MSKISPTPSTAKLIISVCRAHFAVVLLLAAQILLYYSWQLITPQAVLSRWVATSAFFAAVISIWYLAHHTTHQATIKKLVLALVTSDIALASYSVYTQRGMAARAVALYALPIIVAGILASRSALLATAALCVAAYTTTTLSYFVINFNEGLKIELYGEVGFYSALFFVIAWLLWIMRTK